MVMTVGTGTRGCGDRVAGGVYLCTGFSAAGRPPDDFLVDPPHGVDVEVLGITPVGQSLFEIGGVPCVGDWVGEEGYPNVADFVEEYRHMGVSRRVSARFDFTKLRPGSRILLIHPRAGITNWQELAGARTVAPPWPCPKHIYRHHAGDDEVLEEPCASLWWEDIIGGEPPWAGDLFQGRPGDTHPFIYLPPVARERVVRRQIGSTTYVGAEPPVGFVGKHHPAIFLNLPIQGIQVVADPVAGTHENGYAAAKKSGLVVEIVKR